MISNVICQTHRKLGRVIVTPTGWNPRILCPFLLNEGVEDMARIGGEVDEDLPAHAALRVTMREIA